MKILKNDNLKNKFDFFKVAVKNLKTSGTLIPSSKFLAQNMLKNIDFYASNVLVELGPGNGAITHEILKNIGPNSHLICFEVNDEFYQYLKKIRHPQLTVLNVYAEYMLEELAKLGHASTSHIISSLPLTILPEAISHSILKTSLLSLEVNGTFIQFQYSLTYYKYLKKVFKEAISLDFEMLNFPPAFVYRCEKLI